MERRLTGGRSFGPTPGPGLQASQFRRGGTGHSDIPGAVTRHVNDRDRAHDIQGGMQEHEFLLEVYGPGLVPANRCVFGYAFTRQPAIAAGIALQPGDHIIGATPTATAVPRSWFRNDAGLYTGAVLDVTVTGHRRQRAVVTIVFSGVGITLPGGTSADNQSLTDPIYY